MLDIGLRLVEKNQIYNEIPDHSRARKTWQLSHKIWQRAQNGD